MQEATFKTLDILGKAVKRPCKSFALAVEVSVRKNDLYRKEATDRAITVLMQTLREYAELSDEEIALREQAEVVELLLTRDGLQQMLGGDKHEM